MKKIQYSVSMEPNPLHENDPKKAYGNLQLTGQVDINEIADHINSHNSVFSKGTIVGVLTELSECIREMLLQGYAVDLGDIGRFTPSIRTRGAVSREKFTVDNIIDLRVNFAKGPALLSLRRDAEFEETISRTAQKAALKAAKEGKTEADWTPKTEEEEP